MIRRLAFVLTATLSALAAMLLSPPHSFSEPVYVSRTTPEPHRARISWPIAYGRKAAFL